MFSRFRRPAEAAPAELTLDELQVLAPLDPHAFIVSQADNLRDSADNWHEIARDASRRQPEYLPPIRQGLIDIWRKHSGGVPLPDESIIDREADKLASDLIVYTSLTTRHFSGADKGFRRLRRNLIDHFINMPNYTVRHIINSDPFPTNRFIMRQAFLVNKMREADVLSRSILTRFVQTYAYQPEDLLSLSGVYEEGAADFDGRYRELQAIVSTDWHHPVPDSSILHRFCGSLPERPEVFAPGFVADIVSSEHGRKLATIKDMARFALAYAGVDPITDDSLKQALLSTFNRWGEFEELNTTFQAHVGERTGRVVLALGTIAGPRNFKSIRTHPSADQIERLKNYFPVKYAPDRRARRQRDRQDAKKRGTQLPVSEDIAAQGEPGAARDQPKKILIAKGGAQGHELAEADLDGLITHLGIKSKDRALIADIKTMVTWLQANPISGASQTLKAKMYRSIMTASH